MDLSESGCGFSLNRGQIFDFITLIESQFTNFLLLKYFMDTWNQPRWEANKEEKVKENIG